MNEPTPEDVERLEARSESLLQRVDDHEVRAALDELRADRTNGESLAPALQRLSAAVEAAEGTAGSGGGGVNDTERRYGAGESPA